MMGDKSVNDISQSVEVLNNQISEYADIVEDLQEQKEVLKFRSSPVKEIASVDSLLNIYQKKLSNLESARDLFLITSASKDKTKNFELRADNPQDVAKAYFLISYADKTITSGVKESYEGLIVNKLSEEVLVVLTDPAGQTKELLVSKKSQQSFKLTMAGEYEILMKTGNTRQQISASKTVGPQTKYYNDGQEVDLLVAVVKQR